MTTKNDLRKYDLERSWRKLYRERDLLSHTSKKYQKIDDEMKRTRRQLEDLKNPKGE